MHFEIYEDQAGEWRWTLYAVSGLKIADSSEGYTNKADCLRGIDLVQTSGEATIRDRTEIQDFGSVWPTGI